MPALTRDHAASRPLVVKRAAEFIRAAPERRLAELAAGEVSDYRVRVEGIVDLKASQFRQVIDAIRILDSAVRTEWDRRFDWGC